MLQITPDIRGEYQERIVELEKIASYPLGNDFFKIDHGSSYFAFFERLGSLHYFAMLDRERVVAVAAGIIRSVPLRAWYLCDLKVHPDYRGRHIPVRMLSKAFFPNYIKCRRGYAISMNPGDGSPNRVIRMLKRFRWASSNLGPMLELFSLDAEAAVKWRDQIEHYRGPTSFLSLKGKKDLILESTGRPAPILHYQFGPCAEQGQLAPGVGSQHLLCSPCDDGLALALKNGGVLPIATASILHHRMQRVDWRFVLTSDI
jgi:GNAT superfamily N-acetyltransferase